MAGRSGLGMWLKRAPAQNPAGKRHLKRCSFHSATVLLCGRAKGLTIQTTALIFGRSNTRQHAELAELVSSWMARFPKYIPSQTCRAPEFSLAHCSCRRREGGSYYYQTVRPQEVIRTFCRLTGLTDTYWVRSGPAILSCSCTGRGSKRPTI